MYRCGSHAQYSENALTELKNACTSSTGMIVGQTGL